MLTQTDQQRCTIAYWSHAFSLRLHDKYLWEKLEGIKESKVIKRSIVLTPM